jgi:ABC-type Fe2+-enterobactin transport system substrate-binding protein
MNDPFPLVDARGVAHPPDPSARIVSLVPSITEMLCDFGLAPQLVGRTGFCVHPAATVKDIAKVGGTKDFNIDKIRRLAPTHLVVNIDENEKPAVEALAEFVPNIVVTHPLAPRDNLALARLLGGIFCVDQAAETWCAAFENEYARLKATPAKPSRRMLYVIWQDPWMAVSADTYSARMLNEIHWQVPTLPDSARYPVFNWTPDLVDAIDGVLLSTEPYRFTEQHADALEQQLGKPVTLVDGEMLSWYGTRSLQGLRYLQTLQSGER